MFDKIVVVTQKTRLEGLLERFNTRDQAKFWIEHMGLSFADYDREHAAYQGSLERVRREIEGLVSKTQIVERSFLPNFIFTNRDVLVTTGAGSTGWFSSTQNMAQAVARLLLEDRAPELPRMRLPWDDPRLVFVVREPYLSRSSGVQLGAGLIEPGDALVLESHMPEGGVIFSDGVEADAL